jgi:peptidyl-prolyl cis-trans isomerase D
MISAMRGYLKTLHILLWVVVGVFIATSVFVWGKSGLTGNDPQGSVAVVNGERVPVERFQRAYQYATNRLNQMYDGKLTPEMAEQMGLRHQVVDDLVLDVLVQQRARTEGLVATDEEVSARVQALPYFRQNGVFSVKLYEDLLRRNGLTPAAFEEDIRQNLTRMKVHGAVRDGVKVSDAEIDQAWSFRSEKARVAWALVEVAPIVAGTTASDAEVEAYYAEHAADFHRPERRRVQYVVFYPKDSLPVISDADVRAYYDEHPTEFERPHQIHAAHVLVRVAETGGSGAEEAARTKASDVIKRARAGEDFAKLARAISEDPGSAEKGGDLGWVSKGQMVPQFEAAAFGLKSGELTSEPVRSPFGYHVIKVLEVREGTRTPLKDVVAQIRAKLLTERMEKDSSDRASQARAALLGAKDFLAEARHQGLEPQERIVNRPPTQRAMQRADPLTRAAFDVAIGGLSEPIKGANGQFLVKVVEQLAPGVPPLAQIKDEVAGVVRRTKAEAVALERARKLAAEARSGDLVAAARKDGSPSGQPEPFTRIQPTERLTAEAVQAAFQLPAGGVSEPLKSAPGYFVVKTLERIPADAAGLAGERDRLTRELLETKRAQTWDRWIASAREGARIEINETPVSR